MIFAEKGDTRVRGEFDRIIAEQKRQAVEKLTMFLELESAAAIQPSAAALEAGLMEQEQHYPCSAVLP